jgi:hypothetical protein
MTRRAAGVTQRVRDRRRAPARFARSAAHGAQITRALRDARRGMAIAGTVASHAHIVRVL